MNDIQLKHQVIRVISFGRFYSIIKTEECIIYHQWAQLGILPSKSLRDKFYNLKERLLSEKWELPEYQYNTELKLTYKTNDMNSFKPVPNKY